VVAATGFASDKTALSSAWRNTNWFEGTSTSSSQWAVALYAGLWAYDGWDNTNYVVGEMINPGQSLTSILSLSSLYSTNNQMEVFAFKKGDIVEESGFLCLGANRKPIAI
jgi:amino acid transporter